MDPDTSPSGAVVLLAGIALIGVVVAVAQIMRAYERWKAKRRSKREREKGPAIAFDIKPRAKDK